MNTHIWSLLATAVVFAAPSMAQSPPAPPPPGTHNHAPAADAPAPPGMPDMPGMRRMQIVMQGPGNEQRVIERRIQIGNGAGPGMGADAPGGPGGSRMMMMRRPMLGLELATLSPRLGSYFGAKSGVLVVKVDNASLKIEDGDIITAIDGRQPTTAEQARRILRSYAGGEKISLKLVRDRKPLSLDVVMPEPPKVIKLNIDDHGPHGVVAPPPKAP